MSSLTRPESIELNIVYNDPANLNKMLKSYEEPPKETTNVPNSPLSPKRMTEHLTKKPSISESNLPNLFSSDSACSSTDKLPRYVSQGVHSAKSQSLPQSLAEESAIKSPILTRLKQKTSDMREYLFNTTKTPARLGTFEGAFLPCFQGIVNVLYFIRLPFLLGIAGIAHSLLIIGLSVTCTLATALSISAIASNGLVPEGGAYYMVSRSLGKELGGALGVLLYLATSISASVNVIGAAEVLTTYLIPSVGNPENDVRLYGPIILLILLLIVLRGIKDITRLAMCFLLMVLLAIASLIIGSVLPRFNDGSGQLYGLSSNIFWDNFYPDYQSAHQKMGLFSSQWQFVSMFALFFPSVTGLMAASNRSSNLRNPSFAIPIGTLSAIALSSLLYVVTILLLGCSIDRKLMQQETSPQFAMAVISWMPPIVTVLGAFFSALGAALQSLTTAPRLLQAIANDHYIPILRFLERKETGRYTGDQARSRSSRPTVVTLVVTLIVCTMVILIGRIDVTAPLVTVSFLICYMFFNFATALLSYVGAPNWRPSWRPYHWIVSVLGAILCALYMFLISWVAAVVAFVLVTALYKYIEFRGAKVEWGDGLTGMKFKIALRHLLALEERQKVHTRNWRPQLIACVEIIDPLIPNSVLTFLSQLKKGGGLTMVFTVIKGDLMEKIRTGEVERVTRHLLSALQQHQINGFVDVHVAQDTFQAQLQFFNTAGIGKLRPNTVVLQFPESLSLASNFYGLVLGALTMKKVVIVLKNMDDLVQFHSVDDSNTVDVWWIMHDGGILILLAHLLGKHRIWRRANLRIFGVARPTENSVQMKQELEELLLKLRIAAYVEIVELNDEDISEFTYERTLKLDERRRLLAKMNIPAHMDVDVAAEEFKRKGTKSPNVSLEPQLLGAGTQSTLNLRSSAVFSQNETNFSFDTTDERIYSTGNLNRVMIQYSHSSSLIFCNLPLPEKNDTHPELYMQSLNALCTGLNRVVLVKGTGMEVVSLYL